jgi:hypothetical protein
MPPSTGARLCKFVDESPINEWLLANVGACAILKDHVTERHPWHVNHCMAYVEYSFAREHDATMFALKFS